MVAYVRSFLRRGLGRPPSVEVAEEVTQGFIAESVEKGWMERADPLKGLFRGYLQRLLHHYCCAWLDHRNARKRNPPKGSRLLDVTLVGEAPAAAPRPDAPGREFTKAWVGVVLRRAVESLRAEDAAAGEALDRLLEPGSASRALSSTERGRRRAAIAKLRPHFALALRETVRSDLFFEEEWSAVAAYLPGALRPGRESGDEASPGPRSPGTRASSASSSGPSASRGSRRSRGSRSGG
jgi:hypothetical protein